MLKVEALQFTYTFKTYDSFRSEEKDILLNKYSALLGVSSADEFESIYKDTYDYVMQTIYNYYDCYYLTSPTKDRFLTLLGTILSGKLPNYKVKYDNYLDARNLAYDSLGGRKTTSSGGGSGTSGGTQKFANTPEVINSGIDYVDQYSTSENKYNNTRSDNYSKNYDETLKASAKQIWENVKSVPDEIYKEVIKETAKLFFSETMEERQYPEAYLTLTRRVQELGSSVITSLEQQLNTNYELVTTLNTEGNVFEASTDFKHAILKELKTTYDDELHAVQTKWIYRDGFEGVDTYTIPMSSLTTAGLMSSEQFSKLDQVVLYGTNFETSGEQYAVRQDEDHDLYVVVPKGQIAIASKDETGVVQLYANQLTIPVETTLYSSDLKVPVQMDSRNKIFVEVPNYILPEATTTAYGGIKLFNERKTTEVTPTTYDTGENLPVEVDSNGKAFVNNGFKTITKLYSEIGIFNAYFSSDYTDYTITNSMIGNTIKINMKSSSFAPTIQYEPNLSYFKTTPNTMKYLYISLSSTGTKFVLENERPVFTYLDNGNKLMISFGKGAMQKAESVFDICQCSNITIYVDTITPNNSYLEFTIDEWSKEDISSYTVYWRTISDVSTSWSGKIADMSYSFYTGGVIINGKAYNL